MVKKIVRITRAGERKYEGYFEGARRPSWGLYGLMNSEEVTQPNVQINLWEVDERDIARSVEVLAKANPGADIEVFELKEVGHCPAGDFVRKQVSADGILPA